MKTLFKCSKALILLLLMAAAWSLNAQNPSYLCMAKNGTLLNSKVYQFDIYIYQTGSVPLPLNNYQLAFSIPNTDAITHGGTLTVSYVAGTSELTGFAPSNVNAASVNGLKLLRINGPLFCPTGILVPPSGLRVGTFRITNTADYGQVNRNLAWSNTGPYNTRVYALIGGISTEITDFPASHLFGYTDPLTDKPGTLANFVTGIFCPNGSGISAGVTPAPVNEAMVKNYPNPFSEKTSLVFILPEDNRVKLEVYDLAGKLVKTLYNGKVNNNKEYKVEFDGATLPTGIYIYKMTTNEDVITGKMMMIRE
jgi:hypothetical protein